MVETWRRHGPWAACQVALEQLLNGLVYFERLHVVELHRPAAHAGQAPVRHALSAGEAVEAPPDTLVADEPTLRRLQHEGGWGIDDTKCALWRAGDTCLLSRVDGRIAGYTWVHTGGHPEILPGLRLQLPAGVLYNFAGFTHPAFRGAGLQSRRHLAVWTRPEWAGYDRMLGYVKATNFASRQGQARSGYRRIGSVVLLGTPRHFAAWLSPALRTRGLRRVQAPPPWIWRLLQAWRRRRQRAWVAFVSLTLGPWLHRRLLDQSPRSTQHAFTCFYRAPTQLSALTGPVLQHLGLGAVQASAARRRLRVLLYACSNGAEAYTWSAWLAVLRPDLDVSIEASDLHPALVERARRGRYTWEEITQHQTVPAWFIDEVFDRDGDGFVVNGRTRARVRFSCADIVQDDLRGRFGQADIVLAQNVLFHLPPDAARRAFGNVLQTLAPAGALFIEGMDPDLRVSLTLANGLRPLVWRNREIYEESRRLIPARWWQVYYGAEPWLPLRRHRLRRYGTIFLAEPPSGMVPQQAWAA